MPSKISGPQTGKHHMICTCMESKDIDTIEVKSRIDAWEIKKIKMFINEYNRLVMKKAEMCYTT